MLGIPVVVSDEETEYMAEGDPLDCSATAAIEPPIPKRTPRRSRHSPRDQLSMSVSSVSSVSPITDKSQPFQLFSPSGANYGIWRRTDVVLIETGIDTLLSNPSKFLPKETLVYDPNTLTVFWGAAYYKWKELYEACPADNILPGFVREPNEVSVVSSKHSHIGILDSRHKDRFSEEAYQTNYDKRVLADFLETFHDGDLDKKFCTVLRTIQMHHTAMSGSDRSCKLSWIPGVEGRKQGAITVDIGSRTMKAVDNFSGKQYANVPCHPGMKSKQIREAVDALFDACQVNKEIQGGFATGTWRRSKSAKAFKTLQKAFASFGIHEIFKLDQTKEALYGSMSALQAVAPYAVGMDKVISFETGRGSAQMVTYQRVTLTDLVSGQ